MSSRQNSDAFAMLDWLLACLEMQISVNVDSNLCSPAPALQHFWQMRLYKKCASRLWELLVTLAF
jgi:hypothetical protein